VRVCLTGIELRESRYMSKVSNCRLVVVESKEMKRHWFVEEVSEVVYSLSLKKTFWPIVFWFKGYVCVWVESTSTSFRLSYVVSVSIVE
jgi:hypothetical protein